LFECESGGAGAEHPEHERIGTYGAHLVLVAVFITLVYIR
jgi:hypothetical protein